MNPRAQPPSPHDVAHRAVRGRRESAEHAVLDIRRRSARKARSQRKVGKPRMFKVVLLNDDYTPMEFVVHVLRRFFRFKLEAAKRLMLEIHHHGRGVCGIFSKDIAETKANIVNKHARSQKHPLLCVIEPDTDAE